MIPKKIHYCWLSEDIIPENIQNCINSWKRIMPEYEIVLWDTNRFNINSNQFVKEACTQKKWAFATDYIRIYALYTEGGIYLDSDVMVKKSFDAFLDFDFFTAIEYHPEIVEREKTIELLNDDGTAKFASIKGGIGMQAAVLGSIKEHPFLLDCLNYYNDKQFISENGNHFSEFMAPGIYAMIGEKYGFRYVDERQILKNNMLILPSDIIAGSASYEKSTNYAIHYCNGSWREVTLEYKVKKFFRKFKRLYKNLSIRQ